MAAQDIRLRSNVRPVTTQFFGKSANTGKMPAKIPALPILCAFAIGWATLVAAADPAENLDPPLPRQSRQLLDGAIRGLEAHQSISAKIFQQVDLFDKRLIGSGLYLEQRRGPVRLMRQELRIQLGQQISSLVQVCDGHFLWTYQKLSGQEVLRRLDVARALPAIEQAKELPRQGKLGGLPGLGGLPKLMHALDAAFDFQVAEPAVLRLQADHLPVWRLSGRWKPNLVTKLLPEQAKAIESGRAADFSKLADHLPDHVVLMLGREDLFPYRIEFCRTVDAGSDPPETRAIVTMQLFEVLFDVPIASSRFRYNPGDLDFEDETPGLLKSLGLEE